MRQVMTWRPTTVCTALLALSLMGCNSGPTTSTDPTGTGGDPGAPPVTQEPVPAPEVLGPVTGGIRTGEPWGTTMVPLIEGYVEEEFSFGGLARGHGDAADTESAYRTRMTVRRPVDPDDFNGTVVLDWNNVTLQFDIESTWAAANDVLMERGFIYVGVSAQKQGVDGAPTSLYFWDPVRYADLMHPGDDYSFDIFSQAAQAVFDPIVMPAEIRDHIERVVATGSSQSAGRLTTYINEVHERDRMFDGYMPQISGSVLDTRKDLVPILWINSQDEAAGIVEAPADEPLFRYWEVAGPPHTTNAGEQYYTSMVIYANSNGVYGSYDPEVAGQYGELDPQGSCNRNRYPVRYVWSSGIVALHKWLVSGQAPDSVPPLARDEVGDLTFDEHGNALGGFRLPIVDVPIGAYFAGQLPVGTSLTHCTPGGLVPLVGTSQTFDPARMMGLYDSHEDYLAQFEAVIPEAVESGRLLPEHAEDLLRRARGTDITNPVPRVPPPPPAGGDPL
ncbi:MAG: hypothetical protein KAG72_10010 [Abyssibacter sp.]|nr:alpha/beta hydrolase domain-containing protein [Abyssibacter sp.]MCK5859669.1 hypothetical protein [Abyssibacter sp.]